MIQHLLSASSKNENDIYIYIYGSDDSSPTDMYKEFLICHANYSNLRYHI